jgi:hypothetical protein
MVSVFPDHYPGVLLLLHPAAAAVATTLNQWRTRCEESWPSIVGSLDVELITGQRG